MDRPLIVLAHGAGVPSSSPWMQRWRRQLEALGPVVTFDYPYAREGRKRPDPQAKLVAAHRDVLEQARGGHDGSVVLAGKSMGSRIGCHLAVEQRAQGAPVDALVCFGYPLVSPGKSRSVRDQVLYELDTPVLFIQGTRDRLCPLDRLEQVRARMRAPNELFVVEEGDHSLEATKRYLKSEGIEQPQVDARILGAIEAFLARQLR